MGASERARLPFGEKRGKSREKEGRCQGETVHLQKVTHRCRRLIVLLGKELREGQQYRKGESGKDWEIQTSLITQSATRASSGGGAC